MINRASPSGEGHSLKNKRSALARGFLGALIVLIIAAGCTLPTGQAETTVQISGAPLVRVAAPQANATFLEGVEVFIQASITNAGPDISRVEVAVDRTIIATLQSPNQAGGAVFSITQAWTAAEEGQHTVEVTAFRADGSSSAPAAVTINVIGEASRATPTTTPEEETTSSGGSSGGSAGGDAPRPTTAPTNPPPPTDPPAPTEVPASPTPDVPIAVISPNNSGGVNVRSGPDTVFPAIGTLATNASVEIIGLNTGEDWLKVRFNITSEGWILAQLATIQGDISGLPREAGPPRPATAVPTPIPATAVPPTPASSVNLVPQQQFLSQPIPTCRTAFTAGFTVRNDSTVASSTGLLRIQIVRVSTGEVFRTSGDALVAVTLQPGATHTVQFEFTVDVFTNETHRVEFIADVNSQVAESNENDNRIGIDYPFGGC